MPLDQIDASRDVAPTEDLIEPRHAGGRTIRVLVRHFFPQQYGCGPPRPATNAGAGGRNPHANGTASAVCVGSHPMPTGKPRARAVSDLHWVRRGTWTTPERHCPMDLVERDTLLGQLEELLGSIVRGSGHTVFVAGEAGIGKTSLLKALAERRGEALLWSAGRVRRAADAAAVGAAARHRALGRRRVSRAARPRGPARRVVRCRIDRAAAQPQAGAVW